MRVAPKSWHNEAWICSIEGHVAPTADVQRLSDADAALGVDLDDSTRLSRCLRCDLWVPVPLPRSSELPVLRDTGDPLPAPRRQRALEDAIIMRLIAIERGVHAVAFLLIAGAIALIWSHLRSVHRWSSSLVDQLSNGGHHTISSALSKISHLHSSTLLFLFIMAILYAAIEGIEAVGLWYERRWAEYLTVIATAGFLPLEIHELIAKVSVLRLGALVANVMIIVYLVVAKRLFGVRSGAPAPFDSSAHVEDPKRTHHRLS